MEKKKIASRVFNIYLIKMKFKRDDEIIPNIDQLRSHNIRLAQAVDGNLYIKASKPLRPRWASLFESQIDLSKEKIISSGSSAVLVVKMKGRIFALTFGYGRTLLNKEALEERFGLRVTLNTIDVEKIRTIDRKSLDAIPKIMKEQASKEGPVAHFSLNIVNELIRSFSGIPADQTFGTRLAGTDSLTVSIKANLDDIPALLATCFDKWNDTSYKIKFPWIDHIEEVRDPSIVNRLENELVSKIKSNNFDKMWLSVPDLLDWSDIAGFRYRDSKTDSIQKDIHFDTFLSTVREIDSLSIDFLKHRNVFCISESTDIVVDKWSIFHCIYSEIEIDDKTYLLTDGKWYCIDPSFVRQIDKDISELRQTNIKLPKYIDKNEEEYNARVCKASIKELILMDRKLIPYGGGASRIEFCDIYSKQGTIIHVKRYGGSSVLSYLFLQGSNSAESFLFEPEFRTAVNKKLPTSHKLLNPKDRIVTSQHEIAFVVISKSKKTLTLPFFSRLTLRNVYRRLQGFGYKVTLTKVDAI
jgi:uncharacterized protein (TIGR04141 family)